MNVTYQQSTGWLLSDKGERLAVGYAGGNCGQNPEGCNNPSMQDAPRIGPLPQGWYTMTGTEDSPHLGPFAILLEPDAENTMYGRSDFRIHGDSIAHPGEASEGCIIVPRSVREAIYSPGARLQVIR